MSQDQTQSRNPQPPIQEFRAGGVKAAIWKREVQKDNRTVVEYSVKITRSYRDKQNEWHESDTYFPHDIPKLILVAQKAYEFVFLKQHEALEAEQDDLPV